MILDTDFLIDVMNSDEGALEKAVELEDRRIPQRVPLMAVYELFIGIGAGALPERERRKIRGVLEPRTVPAMTEQVAERAGIVQGELMAAGEGIGAVDAIIGATGQILEEPVLTRNVEHFERIPGLDIETY